MCLLPDANLDIDILDGELEMRQERDGERIVQSGAVSRIHLYPLESSNVAKKIFRQGRNHYKAPCYVFFQGRCRL